MTYEAATLNYMFEGPDDAPVLVMSNSLGTNIGMWDDQAPELSRSFRLLRYDHRGHGGSSVPDGPYSIEDLGRDLLALLDREDIGQFSFCGLSVGGMVGMWVASEVPARVERLVLCCTSAKLGPPEMWNERVATARDSGVSALTDAVLERWFTPGFREREPEKVARIRAMLHATSGEGYAGVSEAIRDMDLRDRLGRIAAPTLVVSGSDDPSTPPEHGREIDASVPDSRMVVVDDAAHLANIEKPEEVTGHIVEHLSPLGRG